MQYNVLIEKDGEGVQVNWGNDPGWKERYADNLENADRISFVPKPGENLPTISVALPGEKRWIIFSRVFEKLAIASQRKTTVRLYAIGWQETINGTNVKNITWIYPNGFMEVNDKPSYVKYFQNAQ